MYFADHGPAHFHAVYAGHRAVFEIETLALVRGLLPRRAQALVLEWAALYRADLRQNWTLARTQQPLYKITPLE